MPEVTTPPAIPPHTETLDALETATREVLETMFFTDVAGDAETGCVPDAVAARVRFHGQPSGLFSVTVSAASARRMAADFLGEDLPEEVAGETVGGVIGELANMICGAVLSRVDSGGTFRLDAPELACQDSPVPEAAASRVLDLGDGCIRIAVEWMAA